jgi:putative transcriptional regulator
MDITGNLLIAPPSVKGNFWYKTVVLITENHANGSMGLVLNKRSQMTINEFASQLGIHIDIPGFVYLGGPVSVKNLSFLHSTEWSCDNTMPINDHFNLSSSEQILPRLALGDRPKRWRLFLGLCGWGPNQLMNEIKGVPPYPHENSWCVAHSDPDLVFETDQKEQWISALDKSGLEFARTVLS